MERRLSLRARRELIEHQRQAYQEAEPLTKCAVLDEIVALTGYHRSYARWLLNHPEASQSGEKQVRPHLYGPEVQHVLFLVWHAANRICTKRLMPYLPTWLDVLERHEYLQITPECRAQLLAMSASTADRLLRAQRMYGLYGLSTTKAGTLLRQQVPIRPSQYWNGTQPGFLEADLVAHTGPNKEGMYLFTLTLTDVATGWTECVPVSSKSQEVVLEAFQRARTLFPFPILGLDVDCGSEFLNEQMVAYCTREQIMLTRGRPTMKNDQCFVEAKNRHIVRQVVGHDRYCGDYACRQMWEVYRALRLYVNCFQPSMKLMPKEEDVTPICRRYDPAKTPLQRVLLSGVLSPTKEQELTTIVQALDPVRLLHQLKELQAALFCGTVNASPFAHHQPVTPTQVFAWERCIDGSLPSSLCPAPAHTSSGEKELSVEHLLDWKRYHTNPFEGEWEYIVSYLREYPDVTAASLFRHLQSRSPGRYHPGQLRCLQRGIRQIRTRLLAMRTESEPAELIHGNLPAESVSPSRSLTLTLGTPAEAPGGTDVSDAEAMRATLVGPRRGRRRKAASARCSDHTSITPPGETEVTSSEQGTSPPQENPLDHAIQAYLQEQADAGRRPKTLQWHQTALGQFRAYLYAHQQDQNLDALTDSVVQQWLTFLQTTPTSTGALRSSVTIATYARSVRVFGNWLVRTGKRAYVLFSAQPCPTLPTPRPKQVQVVEPEAFARLLEVCQCPGSTETGAKRTAARNRALLWLLWDGGLRVAELCALRRKDVFPQQGIVRVKGTGFGERRIALGPEGQQALRVYLDLLAQGTPPERHDHEDALFQTEAGTPLTINGLQSLFVRLNRRTNLPATHINPSMLRDTFAVRYLQNGGHLEALQEMLGLNELVSVKRYQRFSEKQIGGGRRVQGHTH